MMKILRVNHIGVVPKDIDQATKFFRDILGLPHMGTELVANQKTIVHFLKVDDTSIELLEPASEDSPITEHLRTRGSGIQHVSLEVEDIVQSLNHLKSIGVKLIHESPRPGGHNSKIAFIHPHSTGGILVELVESAKK